MSSFSPRVKIGYFKIGFEQFPSFSFYHYFSSLNPAESPGSTSFVVIYHQDIVPSELLLKVEKAQEQGAKFLLLQLKSGKRDHPTDYWEKVLFPQCLNYFGNDLTTVNLIFLCYEFEQTQIEACAVIAIAAVYSFQPEALSANDLLCHRQKDVFKSILLQIQLAYPAINPPRRFMKELSKYFNKIEDKGYSL
jgi:hypothetical protein